MSARRRLIARASWRAAFRFSLIPHPSALIPLVAALLLAGCGFHLRGQASLPFKALYVQGSPASVFTIQLRRVIGSGSDTRITNDPAEADAFLQVLRENQEQEILSLSPGGRVRELQLRFRVQYQVLDKNKTIITPATEIILRRDFSINDQDPRGIDSEQALLYRDMQTDAAYQIVRRLQAQTAAKQT